MPDPHFPLLAAAIATVHRASGATYADVLKQDPTEMLPALLGGRWARNPRDHFPEDMEPIKADGVLLDAVMVFYRRPKPTHVLVTNAALIAMPYRPEDRDAPVGAEAAAARYAAHGLGVWVRPSLTVRSYGPASLVVMAQGLRPEDAPRWGFRALA